MMFKKAATLVLLPDELSWKERQLLPDHRSWKERGRVDLRKRKRVDFRKRKRVDFRKRDRTSYVRPDRGNRPKCRSGKRKMMPEPIVKQEQQEEEFQRLAVSVPPVVKQDAAMPVLPVVKKEARLEELEEKETADCRESRKETTSRKAPRTCNKAFGCGRALCDQCYPPGDAPGRRRL